MNRFSEGDSVNTPDGDGTVFYVFPYGGRVAVQLPTSKHPINYYREDVSHR